jgi:hypothetical protein
MVHEVNLDIVPNSGPVASTLIPNRGDMVRNTSRSGQYTLSDVSELFRK